jgi:hypothetical protein
MLEQYLDLVSGLPVFELCFDGGLERLPSILEAIERRTAGPVGLVE